MSAAEHLARTGSSGNRTVFVDYAAPEQRFRPSAMTALAGRRRQR